MKSVGGFTITTVAKYIFAQYVASNLASSPFISLVGRLLVRITKVIGDIEVSPLDASLHNIWAINNKKR